MNRSDELDESTTTGRTSKVIAQIPDTIRRVIREMGLDSNQGHTPTPEVPSTGISFRAKQVTLKTYRNQSNVQLSDNDCTLSTINK